MNIQRISSYRLASRWSSGIVLAMGLLALMGWLFEIPALTSILPGLATMKANSALGFVLAGISLWQVTGEYKDQRSKLIAKVCATITMLIGLFTLGEYMFDRDFGIDQLLFRDELTPLNPHPGRMSPATALNLLLLGCALLLIDNRWSNWLNEALAITALMIAAVAVFGYIYGVSSLYQIGVYSSIALHTALTFVVLSLGILSARPERGLISILSTEGGAGILARRLLPAAIGIPIALGWLILSGQRIGLYDTAFGIALFALSNVIIFSGLIRWNADMLHRAEVERIQARNDLLDNEKRYRRFFENMHETFVIQEIITDNDGKPIDLRFLDLNPAAERMLGKTRSELVGRTRSEIAGRPDPEGVEMANRVASTGMPFHMVRSSPGFGRSFESFTYSLGSGIVATLSLDITERKKAEEALRLTEQRLRALIENSWDAIALFGADGTILYGSPSTVQILGYSLDEFIGRNAFELIHEEDQAFVTERLTISLQQPGAHITVYARVRHKNGEWRWLEGVFTNLLNEPSVQAIVNNYHDFTERKQDEDALRESEAHKSAILESALDCIITIDHQGRILEFNPAAEATFGYTRAEAIGKEMAELIIPQPLREQHRRGLARYLSTGDGPVLGRRIEINGMRADGTEFPVELAITPIKGEDPPVFTGFLRDITESKRAEGAVSASEERFRLIVEAAPSAMIVVDRDGKIDLVNAKAQELFGYRKEELLGRPVEMLVPGRFRSGHANYRRSFLAQPSSRPMGAGRDLFGLHKDGHEVPIEIGLTPYESSEVQFTLALIVDITERRLSEDILHKNVTRTQALAELSRAVAAAHLDYQAVLDLIAERTTELIGDACAIRLVSDDEQWLETVSLYHPEARKLAFLREMLAANPLRADAGLGAQVIQRGQPVLIPVISPEQLKSIIPSTAWPIMEHVSIHSLLIIPLRAQGGVVGTLTLTRDHPDHPYTSEDQAFLQDLADRAALSIVNARLYAAMQKLNNELEQRVVERTAALTQANGLLHMMLDHMPDQIYFKDAQSRFIKNSRSQAKALGLSDPDEAVGKSDFDFFPHAQQSFDKEQEIIRSGKPLVDEEERVVWPDGQETWVSTTKVPLRDQEGKIIGTFGISRDITDRKRAGIALQKAKLEMEAANKELEAFSYSVSHDLRAPLRSVDGFSQALLEDYGDMLPPDGRNFLERIRSSAQRMAELIDDLLNLSKVTRASMKLVPVDLSQLAQGIVAELQRTHRERKVNINITPNLKVRGDPGLLQAVLENLLNNAWKFTSKREQAEIEFGSKLENEETIYFIRDNGAGFDMAYVGKLFGAFQRLHAMTEYSGTGIGLATVQRIINRHGGRIWAEGAVDQGATFSFTLPVLTGVQQTTPAREEDSIYKRAKEII